jgi:cytochrome c5
MKKVMTFALAVGLFGFFLTGCDNSGSQEKSEKKEVKQEVKKETKEVKEETQKEFTANLDNGKAVYDKACIACHWKGVAGAAALTDKDRWEEIAAKGMKTLHQHAIDGFQGEYGVMPAKGTCADCSDQDLYDAISYMLKEAGVTAAQ